ncbi:MAG: hypothetical protein ACLSHG_13065 [Oscillospiraceae bacterium]
MYINQNRYNEAMSYKQNDAERMIKRAEGNKDGTSTVTPEERYHALCTIYNFYSPNMCQRFGTRARHVRLRLFRSGHGHHSDPSPQDRLL